MPNYYYAAFVPTLQGFSILAPDFPEVASQGMTVAECMEMAADAIACTVEEYAKARKELPAASNLNESRAAVAKELASLGESFPDETLFQLIKAPSVDMTPIKISISVARSVLENIDSKASGEGMTRSAFLVKAAEEYRGSANSA